MSEPFVLSTTIGYEVSTNFSYLVGKLCTIIEASYSDPKQCKAVKDLVKSACYGQNKDLNTAIGNIIDAFEAEASAEAEGGPKVFLTEPDGETPELAESAIMREMTGVGAEDEC